MTIREGTLVQLRGKSGRGFPVSKAVNRCNDMGGWRVVPKLDGCGFWNVSDLVRAPDGATVTE